MQPTRFSCHYICNIELKQSLGSRSELQSWGCTGVYRKVWKKIVSTKRLCSLKMYWDGALSVIVRNGYFSGNYETIDADLLISDMTGFMPLMSKPAGA